jgi:hypothetical protein
MAVVLSRKTAAPVLSVQGAHSGGTAIWQACFESFTTVHPAGNLCAQVGKINKKSRGKTTCFLMAEVYRQPQSDTRLPPVSLPFRVRALPPLKGKRRATTRGECGKYPTVHRASPGAAQKSQRRRRPARSSPNIHGRWANVKDSESMRTDPTSCIAEFFFGKDVWATCAGNWALHTGDYASGEPGIDRGKEGPNVLYRVLSLSVPAIDPSSPIASTGPVDWKE